MYMHAITIEEKVHHEVKGELKEVYGRIQRKIREQRNVAINIQSKSFKSEKIIDLETY